MCEKRYIFVTIGAIMYSLFQLFYKNLPLQIFQNWSSFVPTPVHAVL